MNWSNSRRETQQGDGSRPLAEEHRKFRKEIREIEERIRHLEGEYRDLGGLHD